MMRLPRWMFWTGTVAVAGLLLAPALRAAETSGPAQGSQVPLLHVDPFNDAEGEYCVTCRAGKMPTVVALVTSDTAASRAVISAVEEAYVAGRERNLKGVVVLVGTADSTKSLRDWASEKKLTIPVAVAAPDYKDIPAWKVNSKVAATVTLIKERKVVSSLADPDHQSARNGVADLTN